MERAMSACALLGSDSLAAPLICAALGGLLIALVALGFGPLRARLGPAGRSGQADATVPGIWQLSRLLDPTTTPRRIRAGSTRDRDSGREVVALPTAE